MESSPQIGQNLGGNALSRAMVRKLLRNLVAQEMQCSSQTRLSLAPGLGVLSRQHTPNLSQPTAARPSRPSRTDFEHASCVPEADFYRASAAKFGNYLKNKGA